MFIITTILIITLGFLLRSNKRYTYFMLFWMWIQFAFNTVNGDYIPYTRIYKHIVEGNSIVIGQYEKGFVFLAYICGHTLDFTYEQFIVVMATFSIVLFAIVLQLFCAEGNQNLVISIFMVLMYWVMICQYRTFISILFSLIGIYFLEHQEGIKSILLFVLFVFLGVLFHRAAGLFLILILAKRFNIKVIYTLIPLFLLLTVVLKSNTAISIISRYVPMYKVERWLMFDSGTRSWMGLVMVIFSRVLLPFLEQYCYSMEITHGEDPKFSYMKIQDFIIKISYISWAFIPLEFAITDYERLARLPLILSMFFISIILSKHKYGFHSVPLGVVLFFVYYVIYGWMYFISYNGWIYHNLIPILTNNKLIDIIGF